MSVGIREAAIEDAPAVMDIAARLKLRPASAQRRTQRGFLLDVSLDQYRRFVANDDVLVMEELGSQELIGFSIVLGPETMEHTGLRQQSEQIEWGSLSSGQFDADTSAYFEQIAFLPRYFGTVYPAYLALACLCRAFRKYENLFAAVVSSPLRNSAPLGYLRIAGWEKAGSIVVQYPEYGQVGYDVYYLSRGLFETKLGEPFFKALLQRIRTRKVCDL